LARLPLDELDLVVIENVGNLVCPAEFDVGEHARAMIYSITEGEEKPLKYPVMFRSADLVAINKIDLLPYLDFDLDLFRANLYKINPGVTTMVVSARTGEGVDKWCEWLRAQVNATAAAGTR
jgi:hydrogenase nickel incorporation protein HypB